MNTGAITGLNITQVENDLTNFHNTSDQTIKLLGTAFTYLFSELYQYWASPNALAYTQTIIPEINEKLSNLLTERNHILSGASYAANTLARVNGATFNGYFSIEQGQTFQYSLEVQKCRDNSDNKVGMNISMVKILLIAFENQMKQALDSFDNIPTAIAFYDNNGDLISTYERNVTGFKSIFTEELESIKTSINEYMTTETENSLMAKNQAIDVLSS